MKGGKKLEGGDTEKVWGWVGNSRVRRQKGKR